MALQRIIGTAFDDELRELRREKAPQAADALELADLLGDSPLQRSVPILDFGGKCLDRVVQAFDPEHRAYAGGQCGVVDRFGQVLVAAGLEPRDHVLRVRHRGHHNDRRERERGIGTQAPTHLEAVELGHHDVEQDQIRSMLPGGCQPFLAIGRGEDLVAFRDQSSLQDLDVRRVVVDDEDARRGSHQR